MNKYDLKNTIASIHSHVYEQNPHDTLGLFILRKNLLDPIITDIQNELHYYICEAKIIIHAIDNFLEKRTGGFDCTVGDSKCQTRAVMIIDLLGKSTHLKPHFELTKLNLHTFITTIEKLLSEFDKKNIKKEKIQELKKISLKTILNSLNISFNLTVELKFISICTLLSLNNEQVDKLSSHKLGSKKKKSFVEIAKGQLCHMTIQYEQELAKLQQNRDVELSLNHIFKTNFCPITLFFPNFKVLLDHVKKQNFLMTKNIIFCSCGGVIEKKLSLFEFSKNTFLNISHKHHSIKDPLVSVFGYQFSGSVKKLLYLQNISDESNLINSRCLKKCCCTLPEPPLSINQKIEEILLANSAQHSQFGTNAEIDWKSLGLENSALKKEYDYLKTVPGCNIEDMSTFCIRHISASTIAEVKEGSSEEITFC